MLKFRTLVVMFTLLAGSNGMISQPLTTGSISRTPMGGSDNSASKMYCSNYKSLSDLDTAISGNIDIGSIGHDCFEKLNSCTLTEMESISSRTKETFKNNVKLPVIQQYILPNPDGSHTSSNLGILKLILSTYQKDEEITGELLSLLINHVSSIGNYILQFSNSLSTVELEKILCTDVVAKLGPEECKHLKKPHLKAMKPSAFNKITQSCLREIQPHELKNFPPSKFKEINPLAIATFTPKQLENLGSEAIKEMTAEQAENWGLPIEGKPDLDETMSPEEIQHIKDDFMRKNPSHNCIWISKNYKKLPKDVIPILKARCSVLWSGSERLVVGGLTFVCILVTIFAMLI